MNKDKYKILFALFIVLSELSGINKSSAQCNGIDFKAGTRSGCALLVVQFSAAGTSSSTGTKFQWDFGNGYVTGNDTITKAFPNAGKYSISMKASLSGGTTCTVTKDTFISVLSNPSPVMYINSGSKICNRVETYLSFTDSTIGSASREWIIEGNTFNAKSIIYKFATTGGQDVTLKVTNKNNCTNYIKKTIQVYDSIPLDICASFTVKPKSVTGSFSPVVPKTGGRKIAAYKWLFPGGSPSSSTASNPVVIYPDPSKYYPVALTIVMADGCSYTRRREGFVSPFLSPAFTKACVNQYINVIADPGDTGRHNYTFTFPGSGLVKLPDKDPDPKHAGVLYNKTGTFDATITYQYRGIGCKVSVYYPGFITQQGPHAEFDSKDNRICATLDTVHFINRTDVLGAPDVRYTWEILSPNGKFKKLGPTSSRDTFFVPGQWGAYHVELIAQSSNGCIDSIGYGGFIVVANPKVSINKPPVQCFANADTISCIPEPYAAGEYYKFRWHFWNVADSSDSSSSLSRKCFFYQSLLGTYSATVHVSNGKCSADTIGNSVITVIGDNVNYTISPAAGCLDPDFETTLSINQEKYFPNDPNHPPQYHWRVETTYSNDVTFLSPFARTTKAIFTKPGCYDIMLEVITVKGSDTCRQTVTKYNAVCVGLQTYFEPQKLKCRNDTIVMVNYTDSDARTMKWSVNPPGLSTILPNDTAKNIRIIFHKDTCYNVKLVAGKPINGQWCKDSTIQNMCIGPPLPGFFTSTPQIYCAPSIARFNSTTGKNVSYFIWNFGDGDSLVTNSDSLVSHVYQHFNKTEYNVSLTAFDKYGCSNTISRKNLIHVTGPVPYFTIDNSAGCDSVKVKFVNKSSKVSEFIFLFDDGTDPLMNSFPETHTYRLQDPALDSFIFYPAMISKDDTLCKAFYQTPVKIYRKPVDAKISADVYSGCIPLKVHFNVNSRGADSWNWDFNGDGIFDASGKNPDYTFLKPGKYIVKLIASNTACSNTVFCDTIYVSENAKAGFVLSNNKICGKELISIKNTSSGYSSFIFDYGDGSQKDANRILSHLYYFDPKRNSGDSLVFYPMIKVYNAGGCTDSFRSRIVIYKMPVAGFAPSAVSGCSPLDIRFRDTSSNRFVSEWDFDNNGITDAYGLISDFKYYPGIYSVKLRSISFDGCIDSIVKINFITVNDPPKADFKVSDSDICYGTKVHFLNLTYPFQEVKNWFWKFNEPDHPGDTSLEKDPNFTFFSKGSHKVQLTATDNKGCSNTINKQVIFVEDTLPPKTCNMAYVSVKDSNVVEVSWQRNSSALVKGYYLSRLENGKPLLVHQSFKVNDTFFTDRNVVLNTLQSSYCYSVQAINFCGKVSEESQNHCTILLNGFSIQGLANILNWSPYIGWIPGYYRIYRAGTDGKYKIIDSVKGNIITYTDSTDCDENYCYFIEAFNVTGKYNSQSNPLCLISRYEHQKRPVNLRYVSVENNKNIRLVWDTIYYKKQDHYAIDRFTKNKGWVYNFATSTSDSYLDEATEINDAGYTYKISTVDKCGYKGPESNVGTSILLKPKIQKDNILLNWNAYHAWPAGVKNYKLQVRLRTGEFKTIASIPDTVYQDDSVYQFIDTAYCYRVIAFENGIISDSSVSNNTCAVLPSRLFVPNAFTPGNGDSLNEKWKVSALSIYNAAGSELTAFKMCIYDRWGIKVFETNNLYKGWDGIFKGSPAPAGVYIYLINAKGVDNRTIVLKGNLTLLR